MYDPPFELYVGGYAFSYSHERSNELLALFTERDRRRPSQPEESDSDVSEFEEANFDDSVVKNASVESVGSKLGPSDLLLPEPDGAPERSNRDVLIEGNCPTSAVLEPEESASEESNTEETYSEKAYDVPVTIMRERLEIMGFSNARWEEELQEYVNRKIDYAVKNAEEREVGTPARRRAEKRLMIIQRSSLNRWMKKWLLLLDQWLNQSYSVPEDTLM
ncbi:hypothetical protein DYQ86_09640 [Acidobacteria bacterium AB60]|nr:hypothetical protein DYQ86_09640 [Acidobacteria bacterium AB60]